MMETKAERDQEKRPLEQPKPESRMGDGSSGNGKEDKPIDLSKESMPSGHRSGEVKNEAASDKSADRSADKPKEERAKDERPTDLSKESMPSGHRGNEGGDGGRGGDSSDSGRKPVDLSKESMPGGHREEGLREIRAADAQREEPKKPNEY